MTLLKRSQSCHNLSRGALCTFFRARYSAVIIVVVVVFLFFFGMVCLFRRADVLAWPSAFSCTRLICFRLQEVNCYLVLVLGTLAYQQQVTPLAMSVFRSVALGPFLCRGTLSVDGPGIACFGSSCCSSYDIMIIAVAVGNNRRCRRYKAYRVRFLSVLVKNIVGVFSLFSLVGVPVVLLRLMPGRGACRDLSRGPCLLSPYHPVELTGLPFLGQIT